MPTENPKISAYVPQHIYDRFKVYQEEQGLSMSQAVTSILVGYFGSSEFDRDESKDLAETVSVARFEELEKKVELLLTVIPPEWSTGKLPVLESKYTNCSSKDSLEISSSLSSLLIDYYNSETKSIKPIPAYKLSTIRFGKGRNAVSDAKKRKSMEEFSSWTASVDPDGIAWEYVKKPSKGYLPESKLLNKLLSKLPEQKE